VDVGDCVDAALTRARLARLPSPWTGRGIGNGDGEGIKNNHKRVTYEQRRRAQDVGRGSSTICVCVTMPSKRPCSFVTRVCQTIVRLPR
jgi:hypothetical protein